MIITNISIQKVPNSIFEKTSNAVVSLNGSQYLMASSQNERLLNCLNGCNKLLNCSIVVFNSNGYCLLYNQLAFGFLIANSSFSAFYKMDVIAKLTTLASTITTTTTSTSTTSSTTTTTTTKTTTIITTTTTTTLSSFSPTNLTTGLTHYWPINNDLKGINCIY